MNNYCKKCRLRDGCQRKCKEAEVYEKGYNDAKLFNLEEFETMKILELPLKKEWYDMIECGEKREEYREVKPYWEKRLLDYKRLKQYFIDNCKGLLAKRFLFPHRPVIENVCEAFPRGYTHVRFRYGYTKRTMMFTIDSITMGFDGRPEWGAPTDKPVFIIKFH